MEVTKPCEFIWFGAMEITKPCEFIWFGAMETTNPYEFIGFGAMEVTKLYEFIGLGPWMSPLWLHWSLACWAGRLMEMVPGSGLAGRLCGVIERSHGNMDEWVDDGIFLFFLTGIRYRTGGKQPRAI